MAVAHRQISQGEISTVSHLSSPANNPIALLVETSNSRSCLSWYGLGVGVVLLVVYSSTLVFVGLRNIFHPSIAVALTLVSVLCLCGMIARAVRALLD